MFEICTAFNERLKKMKNKAEKKPIEERGENQQLNEELELIIRQKKIQNKILKELIDQIKNTK